MEDETRQNHSTEGSASRVKHMALTMTEVRRDLDSIVDRLVADGPSARPVVFGAYRRREAVMVSAEWYEERLPMIKQLLAER